MAFPALKAKLVGFIVVSISEYPKGSSVVMLIFRIILQSNARKSFFFTIDLDFFFLTFFLEMGSKTSLWIKAVNFLFLEYFSILPYITACSSFLVGSCANAAWLQISKKHIMSVRLKIIWDCRFGKNTIYYS